MTTNPSLPVHRCFCCGAATEQSVEQALRTGWSFQPVRDIAACPAHSIHTHDVNVARIAALHGLSVEEFYRKPLSVRPQR